MRRPRPAALLSSVLACASVAAWAQPEPEGANPPSAGARPHPAAPPGDAGAQVQTAPGAGPVGDGGGATERVERAARKDPSTLAAPRPSNAEAEQAVAPSVEIGEQLSGSGAATVGDAEPPAPSIALELLPGPADAEEAPRASSATVGRAEPQPMLVDMSMEELLNVEVKVPSAITKLRSPETPASVTVITAEDIWNAPARNIYDLLEIYVPSAVWRTDEEGPLLGLRGSMGHRNYRYLLIVNGRVLNAKERYGARSELEQWELSDIRRIEVVRGPGSVTYGAGAMAGVISITTHDASSAPAARLGARVVSEYDSLGTSGSFGSRGEDVSWYAFFSVVRTRGLPARHFNVKNLENFGYIGEDLEPLVEPLD
ncbi:MAG: TonB-dependent receptor plug domain-containing protein, partial [Myxococcales bacterium]|nr:TonB-dependent receptor plug domain-containing protein [Myxococcales bacterium]